MTSVDYLATILLAVIGIAAFINLRNGTFGQWLQAKFLGKSPTSPATTPFTGTGS